MSSNNNLVILDSENKTSPAEVFFAYLSYLPLYIVSLTLCIAGSLIILRYVPNKYKNTATLLVKGDEKAGASRGGGSTDIIDVAMFGGKKVNLENEVELIKSKLLLERVVTKNQFNVQFYSEGKVNTREVYYKSLPFSIVFDSVKDSSRTYDISFVSFDANGGIVENNSKWGNNKKLNFNWNQPFNCFGMNIKVITNDSTYKNINANYKFVWQPVKYATGGILNGLSITPLGSRTTIISLSLVSENAQRGTDVLQALIREYMNQNIEEKSIASTNTVNFITGRLAEVSADLEGVERKSLSIKTANPYFYQKELLTGKTKEFDDNTKLFIEVSGKLDVVSQLQRRIQIKNEADLVPSYLGVDDPTVVFLISTFNQNKMLLANEEKSLSKNSEVVQRARNMLEESKSNLLTRLNDYKNDLEKKRNQLLDNDSNLKKMFGGAAVYEKTTREITRDQSIKEAIYIYLMQRREETLVASAATVSNYQQYDIVATPNNPIEPDRSKYRLYGILLGLALPTLFIYLRSLLNDKISNREEISKKTNAPFVGEISHSNDENAFVVANKSRSIISEQFRIIRTNLQFLIADKKTLLVTSSISGEGKSFIALNLGAVLAISGKKVAVLEFDLRKPKIIKSIGMEKKGVGLSNYLIGQTDNLEDIYYTIDQYPTLHVYGCGPIPPNPAELMLGANMKKLFDNLKANYDYVIIDSAPVGLVGDTFTIAEYADASIYVIRQRYTFKKQVDFINDIYVAKKLPNMGLIINDVKVGARYGYYGYGNSYGYGYGYGYGYSYGYAYGGKSKSSNQYFDDVKPRPKTLGQFLSSIKERIFG